MKWVWRTCFALAAVLAGCWHVVDAVQSCKLIFLEKGYQSFTEKHLKPQVLAALSGRAVMRWDVLCVFVCACWGLTPVWSKRLLNELVPEGTCTASWGSLSETFDWLDIEVRRWDTKVVPRPAFLIQLGPDKIAAGKTTNQIRWPFSTVSNYCCSQGGPDKINQMLEWFSHFWFLPNPFFFPILLSEDTVMPMWTQGELTESLTNLRTKCEGWFMGWITWKW